VPWLPQPEDWDGLSVAAQDGAESSTLNLTRSALRLRRKHSSLHKGTLTWLPSSPGVLTARRQGPDDEPIFVVLNMADSEVEIETDADTVLASCPVDPGGSPLLLPANSCAWLLGASHATNRKER
jgi:alpha-glucosidase